jgi:hypothetical protein
MAKPITISFLFFLLFAKTRKWKNIPEFIKTHFFFQIVLLARRSFECIGIRHRYPDQRPFNHFDGQKKGQQNVPPSHDQPLMLGPGKLMRFG